MTGELDELVALVAHGNAFLAGHGPDAAPELLDTNSTFRFTRSVEFADGDGSPVSGTAPWFAGLRARGASRLWLDADSIDPHFAAVANAGRWWLVADGPHPTEGWRGEWSVVDERAPDHRIWAVVYRPFEPRRKVPPGPGVAEARRELEAALEAVCRFCAGHPTAFDQHFRDAAALLSSDRPTSRRFEDLLPEHGYGLEARRLLAASSRAWLFGGMGSWNDLTFDDAAVEREYNAVGAGLFDALLGAVRAAANSFDAAAT